MNKLLSGTDYVKQDDGPRTTCPKCIQKDMIIKRLQNVLVYIARNESQVENFGVVAELVLKDCNLWESSD